MIGRSAEANLLWDGFPVRSTAARSFMSVAAPRTAKRDWGPGPSCPRFESLLSHAERQFSPAGGIGPGFLPRMSRPSWVIGVPGKDLIRSRLGSGARLNQRPSRWQESLQKPATFCHFWGMVETRCSGGDRNGIDERDPGSGEHNGGLALRGREIGAESGPIASSARTNFGRCSGNAGAGFLPGIPTGSASQGKAQGTLAAASGWCRPSSASARIRCRPG